MQEHEDTPPTSYPLGRGYGHDYMRGGEVNGGYGYRDREDYLRTRGGETVDDADAADAEQDEAGERTNGERPNGERAKPAPRAAADAATDSHHHDRGDDGAGPVPVLERTYGDTGSAWRHSRSFYVTQAQLQQRFYADRPQGEGPYADRLRTLRRHDAELLRDVEEALFHDSWVDASRIDVEVTDGRVVLRGELPNPDEIRFARDDAWSVAGVREVVCELRVAGGD